MKTLPLVLALNVLLFLAGPVLAQDASSGSQPGGLPSYSLDELSMELYTPQHVNIHDLYGTVREIYSRSFVVKENGTPQRSPDNLQLLGDSLLIYDTPDYIARVLEGCGTLDQPGAPTQRGSYPAEHELGLYEYTPRYRSIESIREALAPFHGHVKVQQPDGAGVQEIQRITTSHQGRLIIVRDLAPRVAEIQGLLERIDRPEPHVTVSCLVLRATRDGIDPRVPEELTAELSNLVPYDSFTLLTMGMVTTAVSSGSAIELNMPVPPQGEAAARMILEAFDPETRSLSINSFRFALKNVCEFTTRVTVAADEYVVLGASGPEPIFVVLRLQTVST